MTRFEECFPPNIVQAVYRRLKLDVAENVPGGTDRPLNNVISLAAYKQRISQNRPIEVL